MKKIDEREMKKQKNPKKPLKTKTKKNKGRQEKGGQMQILLWKWEN